MSKHVSHTVIHSVSLSRHLGSYLFFFFRHSWDQNEGGPKSRRTGQAGSVKLL